MTPIEAEAPWTGELAAAHKDLDRLRQEVNAMRCILDSLVITHHDPEDLLQLWRMLQPGLIDELTEPRRVAEPDAEYREPALAGWREVMRRYTSLLESALVGQRSDEAEPESDIKS